MDNQTGFPGALPIIPSGLEGRQLDLVPGEGFWARIEHISVKGEMTRGLDPAMHGRPSPRIWLFLHQPGHGELSAAVAMSFARELAFRDMAALVLDCDDRDQALTRWAGRVEAEGWIDLARYGTSILTSGQAMPFVGRRGYLLGVGSFAPTDVTGEEIDVLVTRLRRQADDLLLVASFDAAGRLWAPAASIRILCWDRDSYPAAEAASQAEKFEQAGCPLTSVVTFEESGAAEKIVDEVLTEVAAPPGHSAFAAPIPPASADEPTEPESRPGEEFPPAAEPEVDDFGWEEEEPTEDLAPAMPAGGTSRVFRIFALAALAAIVAVAAFYFNFVREPAEGPAGQIETAAGTGVMDNERGSGLVEAPAREPLDAATSAVDSSALLAAAALDSLGADDGAPSPVGKALDDNASRVRMVDVGQDEEIPAETGTPTPAGFDMEPYREPVGGKGWALHVYSLPDSAGTAKQIRELDRQGFQSAVRIFDLGDKGRWRRVYLGNFASRAEAREAMPALLEKLRVDWAKPEMLKTSAPE